MPVSAKLLSCWGLDDAIARDQMYRASTARERERWHAVWLVSQGWSAARVAHALGRDPHQHSPVGIRRFSLAMSCPLPCSPEHGPWGDPRALC